MLVTLAWLYLEPRDPSGGGRTTDLVSPELVLDQGGEATSESSAGRLTLPSGGRGPDAAVEQDLGDPWFVDRSDIAMTGLTMREYVSY